MIVYADNHELSDLFLNTLEKIAESNLSIVDLQFLKINS